MPPCAYLPAADAVRACHRRHRSPAAIPRLRSAASARPSATAAFPRLPSRRALIARRSYDYSKSVRYVQRPVRHRIISAMDDTGPKSAAPRNVATTLRYRWSASSWAGWCREILQRDIGFRGNGRHISGLAAPRGGASHDPAQNRGRNRRRKPVVDFCTRRWPEWFGRADRCGRIPQQGRQPTADRISRCQKRRRAAVHVSACHAPCHVSDAGRDARTRKVPGRLPC